MQIPDHYEFLNQSKIVSGKKALEHIPFELRGYNAQKPLVLTNQAIVKYGKIKKFIPAFNDSTITIGAVYDEVPDYVGIGLLRGLSVLFKARGCDSLIAIGSGAVVDAAKALNIMVSGNTDDLFAYFDGRDIGGDLKPLIYIPDGTSSGMEMTNMVTVDNRRTASDLLYPDLVVIDPRMTPGCCSKCVAESAVIALVHAVGAAVQEKHSPMIDAYVHTALQFLSQYMAKGIKRPKNSEAGMGLANAFVSAAIAFSNAPAGITHLLSEELAKSTGISPGVFMRILFPTVISHLTEKKIKMRDELFLALAGFDTYAATPAGERSRAGYEAVLALLKSVKKTLPETMKELHVPPYRYAEAAKAAAEKSGTRFSAVECMAILNQAM